MAEILLFKIPPAGPQEDAAVSINWYQLDAGVSWSPTPVDTILIADLPIDANGVYTWDSLLADPLKYHQLKTVSIYGREAEIGLIIPPRPTVDLNPADNITAKKISDGSNNYKVGDTIELMLELDKDISDLVGDAINILIMDPFETLLGTATANLITGNLYIANYTIPKNLIKIYNPGNLEDNVDYYTITDRWLLSDGGVLDYNFFVKKASLEPAIINNTTIEINISELTATDNTFMSASSVKFTTHMEPFYCSVHDIISIFPEYLGTLDHINLAGEIYTRSLNIDYHMRPDRIFYQDRFLNACRNYVAYEAAYNLLTSSVLNVSNESKEIDTFKISKEYNYDKFLLKNIQDYLVEYGNIILAGGKDNPYNSATFVKGLFDPNRVNANRANVDMLGIDPWVNYSTKNYVYHDETSGDSFEIRGTRTMAYSSRGLNNMYSISHVEYGYRVYD